MSFEWFTGFSTIVLSFMCHPNFCYAKSELLNPSKPRVKKVVAYTVILDCVIYLLVSVAGYISLGDNYMVDLFALRPKLSKNRTLHDFFHFGNFF